MKEKKILKWYFYFILLVSLIFPGGAPAVVSSTQINIALSEELTTCYPEELLGLGYYDVDCSNQEKWLAAVYHDLGIQPLWVNENGPTDQGKLIFAALKSVGVDSISCDRSIGIELDVFVPQHNFAIEYHGGFWHSFDRLETTQQKYKHYKKCDESLKWRYKKGGWGIRFH